MARGEAVAMTSGGEAMFPDAGARAGRVAWRCIGWMGGTAVAYS